MQSLYACLREKDEFYAAELCVNTHRAPVYRYAKAVSEYLKNARLTPYDGGKLYPCGRSINTNPENSHIAVRPEFSYTQSCDFNALHAKSPEAAEFLRHEFTEKVTPLNTPHTIGGAGYTHSFLNYRRILKEGLSGYRERVKCLPEGDFRDAMLVLLEGITAYRLRAIALLEESGADEALTHALMRVPENPAQTVYEALVAWNFMYYIDGCDDIGGLERGLYPYWKGEDLRPLFKELFVHIDLNDAWSLPLGPDYNPLTVQIIDACHNMRRPSIQLLVKKDMPEEIWNAVYASLASGCGQPALYCWDAYREELERRIPEVSREDLAYLAFGGCTETMIEGLSNVGSDDAGINTALIFDEYMRRCLDACESFEMFLEGYLREAQSVIAGVCELLESHRKTRALYRPQPVRTLFVDDCIDKMLDFNAGGARYNWSVINVAGFINVIDSMLPIKALVFDEKIYTPKEFLDKLDSRDPEFLLRCSRFPKHGNDNTELNELTARMAEAVFGEFEKHTCTPGGRYFPVSNQFTTYERAGVPVRATPDGRNAGDPLCDSCGAVYGRDKLGPTALLSSVSSLKPRMVLGTPITNIRIARRNLPTLLKPLVTGYFDMGGMQLQVTSASREELLDALAHPEKHENLIVRIGGFSEYFNRLTPTLQKTVIDRTEY